MTVHRDAAVSGSGRRRRRALRIGNKKSGPLVAPACRSVGIEVSERRHELTPGAAGRQIMIAMMVVIVVAIRSIVPVVMFRTNPFMLVMLQHDLTERKRGRRWSASRCRRGRDRRGNRIMRLATNNRCHPERSRWIPSSCGRRAARAVRRVVVERIVPYIGQRTRYGPDCLGATPRAIRGIPRLRGFAASLGMTPF